MLLISFYKNIEYFVINILFYVWYYVCLQKKKMFYFRLELFQVTTQWLPHPSIFAFYPQSPWTLVVHGWVNNHTLDGRAWSSGDFQSMPRVVLHSRRTFSYEHWGEVVEMTGHFRTSCGKGRISESLRLESFIIRS